MSPAAQKNELEDARDRIRILLAETQPPVDSHVDPLVTTRIAGMTIALYVIEAALRPGASDANLQLALPLSELWRQMWFDHDGELARAIITVQAFARTAETRAFPGRPGRVETLTVVSDRLREATYLTPWYAHLLEGDRWGDVLGYPAPIAAARARAAWPALEQLAWALASEGIELPPHAPPVPGTPLLPLPATARQVSARMELRSAVGSGATVSQMLRPQDADEFVEVWFGTSRRLRPGTRAEFGPDRSPELVLGRAEVFVPGAHRRGSVGSKLWQKVLRWDFRDDTLKLLEVEILGDRFEDELSQTWDAGGPARALLFIHGYRTSFEDAAIRAAQLAVDLDIDGVVAMFSWPSWASAFEYVPDLNQAESAWEQFVEFIQTLRAAGVEQLDVIAHSMGNRIVSWAMERLAGMSARIDRLYLAAADLDPDILRQRLRFYRAVCGDITLYASRGDRALGLSSHLHFVGRVGLTPPMTRVEGVTSIDATPVDDSFLGHGYYAEAPPVLDDIAAALRDTPVAERAGILPVTDEGDPFWRLTRV